MREDGVDISEAAGCVPRGIRQFEPGDFGVVVVCCGCGPGGGAEDDDDDDDDDDDADWRNRPVFRTWEGVERGGSTEDDFRRLRDDIKEKCVGLVEELGREWGLG